MEESLFTLNSNDMEFIDKYLNTQKGNDCLRFLRPIESRGNGKVVYDNKEYWDFSSNDYIGISQHPYIKMAAKKAIDKWGTGASASRLLSGSLSLHHMLEAKIAKFKQKESALVFNSGYQANVGLLPALCKKGDIVFSDKLNHASIIDALKLSEADFVRFRHNDPEHLSDLLNKKRSNYRNAWIVTETVFSMDGDTCPLAKIIDLKEKFNAKLIVDEAHATGIFGAKGAGLVSVESLSDKVDVVMGTFSKALGSFGAYVATDTKIKDYLLNCSRSFIFSTALPPAVVAANFAAIEVVEQEKFRRSELLDKAKFLREGLKDLELNVIGETQIVPWVIGENKKTVEFSNRLKEKGYWVMPVREPTVPKGQSRLRFTVSYNHPKEVIESLIQEISKL